MIRVHWPTPVIILSKIISEKLQFEIKLSSGVIPQEACYGYHRQSRNKNNTRHTKNFLLKNNKITMKKVASKSGVVIGWAGGAEDGRRGAQTFASVVIEAWPRGKLQRLAKYVCFTHPFF